MTTTTKHVYANWKHVLGAVNQWSTQKTHSGLCCLFVGKVAERNDAKTKRNHDIGISSTSCQIRITEVDEYNMFPCIFAPFLEYMYIYNMEHAFVRPQIYLFVQLITLYSAYYIILDRARDGYDVTRILYVCCEIRVTY